MLKFDTSGELIFRYAENTRALLAAKSLSPKFSVSISGGRAAAFVAHFSGKHQRDHFLVCVPPSVHGHEDATPHPCKDCRRILNPVQR